MFGVIYFIFIKIGTKLPNGGNIVGDNSQVIRQIVPQIQNSVKNCSLKKLGSSSIYFQLITYLKNFLSHSSE